MSSAGTAMEKYCEAGVFVAKASAANGSEDERQGPLRVCLCAFGFGGACGVATGQRACALGLRERTPLTAGLELPVVLMPMRGVGARRCCRQG